MIRHIARPLLGSVFVYSGYRALVHPEPVARAAEPLIAVATDIVRPDSRDQVDKRMLARAYGGIQLGAGLLLATGRTPRSASLILAGSLVPATTTHAFWNEQDPAARQEQTALFLKDASLLGGLLIAGFDTEGKPGVMWRTRRAAERLSDRAAAHLPSHHPDDGSDLGESAARYADTAKHVAARAADRLDDVTSVAGERLSDAVHRATPVLSKTASGAAEKAAELGSTVGHNLSALQEQAPQLAADAADGARSARRKIRALRNT